LPHYNARLFDSSREANVNQNQRPVPENFFEDWTERAARAESMIPIIGQLYRKNNVTCYIYGRNLVNRSVIDIMKAHRFVRQIERNELSEFETLPVIEELAKLNLGPAHIDIGRIAAAYMRSDEGLSIEDYVRREVGDAADNPGRLNVYEGLPFKVVYDAAHNPAGMQVLCDTLRPMPVEGRRIAVISGVGFRHGHHIEEIAKIVAGQFDIIICSRRESLPDYALAMVAGDLPLEEVATRLAAAIVAQGVAAETVLTIDLDTAAVDHALARARDGDLVVLLTGLVGWTWERLMRFVETRQGGQAPR